MTIPVYRVPGYPSGKANQYFESLIQAGWTEEQFFFLKGEIACFESASIRMSFEDALDAFIHPPDEIHYPFLKKLNRHIQILEKAVRDEAIQAKAQGGGKDSIAAYLAWVQGTGGKGGVPEEDSNLVGEFKKLAEELEA